MLRQQIQQGRKLWKERQRKKQPRLQGTEAKALQQLKRNQASFHYPKDGFCQPVEFSLIYAMLSAPETFPASVVQAMVEDENFTQYIYTKEGHVSYAQLSAILVYSAETNPPTCSQTSRPKDSENDNNDNDSNDPQQALSVSQKLAKKVLQTVVRYAEENDLDRETEINELLTPVHSVLKKRIDQKELKAVLPLYLGYSAFILTANPLPLVLGLAGTVGADGAEHEMKNMQHLVVEHNRVADVEQTGLLDDQDEDY